MKSAPLAPEDLGGLGVDDAGALQASQVPARDSRRCGSPEGSSGAPLRPAARRTASSHHEHRASRDGLAPHGQRRGEVMGSVSSFSSGTPKSSRIASMSPCLFGDDLVQLVLPVILVIAHARR